MVFGHSGCIRAKMVVIRSMVVFGQSGCIFAILVVIGQKCFYS